MKTLFTALLAHFLLVLPLAATVPDCELLAEQAARLSGVPEGLLSAIARTESGRTVDQTFRAWPWTLNQGGKGSFHPTKEAALLALDAALATGRRNIDIGCMQINFRWHNQAFDDLPSMIDPVQNTKYAARLLRDLHDRLGDWTTAVMHYHSNDAERGKAYAARVMRHVGKPQSPTTPQTPPPVAELNAHRSGLLVATGQPLVAVDSASRTKRQILGKESLALFAKSSAD